MYRHILIPTDGSELAEHGLAHGLALTKSIGAKVSVIFVMEPFSEMRGRFLEAVAKYAELRKE
jgi:nucleotide-binding universal stress UspA family protein